MERKRERENRQGGEVPVIWKKCILLSEQKTGKDRLGNDVYELVEVASSKVRESPWTDEQIALEGREVTKNEQRFLIPIKYRDFPRCQKARIEGRDLEITKVLDLSPRFTSIQVRIYKE